MGALRKDIGYAFRALASRPGYAAATILVLTLAIGANATVFSVFNGFFLRPLPYVDGHRLVSVYNSYPKMGLQDAGTSVPDYLDRREQARSLEELAIFSPVERTLTEGEAPEQLTLTRASPSLFSVLGVSPMLGRAFTEEEATPGNARVVVLSHRLWSTRFGAQPDMLGGDIRLDGEAFQVVGVMPHDFMFPTGDTDAWIPFTITVEQKGDTQRSVTGPSSIGRLRPGATVGQLNAELDAIVRRNLEAGRLQFPGIVEVTGFTGRAEHWRATAVGDLEPMLLLLQGIVLAVLLMACANVANLQLARMTARRKELAVRLSLGAAPGRLARLVLVESLALALIGAVGGVALAHGGLELVSRLGLDRANQGFEFPMDAAVLGFTAGAALLAGLLSAALPLLSLMREDLTRVVHEPGRLGAGGRSMRGVRGTLVVAQIAASAALLVAAGLLSKSFYQLQREGAGFATENVMTAQITLPEVRYGDDASRARFYDQALAALRAIPGLNEAGFTSALPLSGMGSGSTIAVDGYTRERDASLPTALLRSISEGYFPSLGVSLVQGRNFVPREAERVAIVDEVFANRYWPTDSALGKRVRTDAPNAEPNWHTVVGVVPTIKHESLDEDAARGTIYWHYAQRPQPAGAFVLRTSLPPEQLLLHARDAILAIDPQLALHDSISMEARVQRALGSHRVRLVLMLVFGAGALALAVIGVYAVLTWTVTQRSGEIGMRMALGARGEDIVRMVLSQGAMLTIIGLAFGTFGALALGRLLRSQLHEVSGADPAVLCIALTTPAAAALLASWIPARRASRLDPLHALRQE